MYNGPARKYNPYRNRRVRRYNPTPTTYTGAQPDSFASISAARAFLLQHSDPCQISAENKSDAEFRQLQKRIRSAQRLVRKADRRNLRRRIKGAVKKLVEFKGLRRNPDTASCNACGKAFRNFDADRNCPTCGREIKTPKQEKAEAREIIYKAVFQGIENVEISLRDLKNAVLRYAKQAANDDPDIIEEVMQEFQRAVEDSGEHAALPHGPDPLLEDEDDALFEVDEEESLDENYGPATVHTWERVFGPEGEVLLFHVEHLGRRNIKVTPVQSPDFQDGDVILDLTRGLAAFQLQRGREIQVPVTKKMRDHYQGSFLYKVRKMLKGVISLW